MKKIFEQTKWILNFSEDKAMGILGLILFIVTAAVCALIADRLVPCRIPGGFFTAFIFGLFGAWVGGGLMGSIGPDFGCVSLLPTIVGSAVVIFLFSLLSGQLKGRVN